MKRVLRVGAIFHLAVVAIAVVLLNAVILRILLLQPAPGPGLAGLAEGGLLLNSPVIFVAILNSVIGLVRRDWTSTGALLGWSISLAVFWPVLLALWSLGSVQM